MKQSRPCDLMSRRHEISSEAQRSILPAAPSRLSRSPRLFVAVAALVVLLATAAACERVTPPHGWASPVFSGTAVYYSGSTGQLDAFDLSTHKQLWVFPGSQYKQIKLAGIYSTPVLSGKTLYLGGYNGQVYAVNAADGKLVWGGINTGSEIVGGVLVQGNMLYVANTAGHVFALQTSDGKLIWDKTAGSQVYSTPVADRGMIVVSSMNGDVYAFNAQNGNLIWHNTSAQAGVASTPSLQNAHILFGSYDKHYYAIQDSNGKKVWKSPSAGNWFWTPGLISGDNLYAGNLDGYVYALNTATGAIEWRSNVGSPVRSAPQIENNILLVAAQNGTIHGLNPASGKEMWSPISTGGTILANLVQSHSAAYALTEAGNKNGGQLLEINAAHGTTTNALAP